MLPNNLTRYTGANPFTTEDAAGNVFAVFQGPGDMGVCVMRKPDGTMAQIQHPPIYGRPSLDVNPRGAWIVGNKDGKESMSRSFPPRYKIAEYVPFGAAEKALALPNDGRPYATNVEVFGNGTLTAASPWAEFLKLGMFWIRFNKFGQAVGQLQRLARRAGWLE